MFTSNNRRGRSYHGNHGNSNRGNRGFYGSRQNRPSSKYQAKNTIPVSRYSNVATAPVAVEPHVIVDQSFADLGLSPQLLQNIEQHGYTQPTPIQAETIPALLGGRDVVGIANTGTGKTAAFLLPLIDKVLKDSNQGVLILAPTRELALQISEEFEHFAKNLPLGVSLCIGGMSLNTQIQQLKKNPHFVIGTPGRIKDLINRHAFDPRLFTNIVLDEVDRMLDIGFRQDILFLISKLPEERQAALFSATLDKDTVSIMQTFLRTPVMVNVKKQETVSSIHQEVVQIGRDQNKVQVLQDLLVRTDFEKVIVFGRTKHGVNKLEKQLELVGIRVSTIHGNKSQNARMRALKDFKQGRVQALLATDVAARGIDIEGITHVINYDEPSTYEDYVHRIGRTGRAGKVGRALTFVAR